MVFRTAHVSFLLGGQRRSVQLDLSGATESDFFFLEIRRQPVAHGERITVSLEPKAPLILQELTLASPQAYDQQERLFINGYQSWTESREFLPQEAIPGLSRWVKPLVQRYQLRRYGDSHFLPHSAQKGVLCGYTYTYRRTGARFQLLGSLNERSGFTIFRHDVPDHCCLIVKDCQGLEVRSRYEAFDLYLGTGAEEQVFDEYFALAGHTPSLLPRATGWTSWYNYYTNISEDIILRNLEAFARRRIPLDYFQIDDGYQLAVGDWLTPNGKFGGGMARLAQAIHDRGYRAGLWLAPFICEAESRLFLEHPDWVARDRRDRPLVAGYSPGWSGRFYALDLYHPGVHAYLEEVFDTVLRRWGFDMVKLDFLYAAALPRSSVRTRGQAMGEAMDWLRDLAHGRTILGCGVPLGSAFGLVDYCRIGADVALRWEDHLLKHVFHYRERVSTASSLASTISRRQLNRRAFLNDPDVFILRSQNVKLSFRQKHTLLMLNYLLGGLCFTSDDIDQYTPEEMRQYCSQFPVVEVEVGLVEKKGCVYRIPFSCCGEEYVIFSHLGRGNETVFLPRGAYFREGSIVRGTLALAPYETRCLRRINGEEYELIGSTGHLFPGQDVKYFEVTNGEIQLAFDPAARNESTIYVRIPSGAKQATVNGRTCSAFQLGGMDVIAVSSRELSGEDGEREL